MVEAEYAPDWLFAGSPSAVMAVFVDILSDFIQGRFGGMSGGAFCRHINPNREHEYINLKLCHKNHGMVGLRVGSLQAQGVIAVGRYKHQLIDFDFIRELNYGMLGIFDPRLLPHHTSERTRCIDEMDSPDDIWKLKRGVSDPLGHVRLRAGASMCDLKTALGSGTYLSPSCCPSSLAYCPCATSTAHLSRLMPPVPDLVSLCEELLRKVFTPSLSDETDVTFTLPCCAVASTFVDTWRELHFVTPSVSPNATLSIVAEAIAREGHESARSDSAASWAAPRNSDSRIAQLVIGTMARKTWAHADLAQYAKDCFKVDSQPHTGIGTEPAASTSFALHWSPLHDGLSWPCLGRMCVVSEGDSLPSGSSASDGLRITAVLTTDIINAASSWVLHPD
jgi:hypothetical protein